MLKPGGVFVNVEHVAPDNQWCEELFSGLFIDTLIAHNQKYHPEIGSTEMERRFREPEDQHANIHTPLHLQLDWLRGIGFQNVSCFMQIFELAVFGGIRPNS